MGFKDILVHIDNSKSSAARLKFSTRLAAAFEANLIGFDTLYALDVPSYLEAQFGSDIVSKVMQESRQRAAKREQAFLEVTRRAGVRGEWRLVEGKPLDLLVQHGRYTDLLVVGQGNPHDPYDKGKNLADRLVLESGRPQLVIPYVGVYQPLIDHILLAWNGRREAVRTVHDALPLLKRAKKVTVIAMNPAAGKKHGPIPGADISLHLSRHGVNAEAGHMVRNELSFADALLSRAADDGAGMLVMGAYGHSRLRETVLGGATREILQHMTIPVFMSH
ncbi:MAG TPA: universal stress protein [Gammaproteobacteria bacterium]|nr:universal stress protein [Gammaproteobacteria bacterium]